MPKTKEQKRKERELGKKRQLDQSRRRQASALRPREFPEILFLQAETDIAHVDHGFVAAVKRVAGRINFKDKSVFTDSDRVFYRLMRSAGTATADAEWAKAVSSVPVGDCADPMILRYLPVFKIGELIHAELARMNLSSQFLPYCEAQVLLTDTDFRIVFDALLKVSTPFGTAFHSRLRPTFEFGGRPLVPAYSRHAVERVLQRRLLKAGYLGHGQVFAFLAKCLRFDLAVMHGGSPAFCLWDSCLQEARLSERVLGAPYDQSHHYRLGYFPFKEWNGFACARTHLAPGMDGTPEAELIRTSRISKGEEERLWTGVRNSETVAKLVETGDASALEWFHKRGVPQVISIGQSVYDYSHPGARP